mmetsp:Transcript_25316/g.88364  ORF Transcript_25316/g.88364 Transcript_25316/m.88364 type:complete len:218 (-) Transcript_25316:996-1649(-)
MRTRPRLGFLLRLRVRVDRCLLRHSVQRQRDVGVAPRHGTRTCGDDARLHPLQPGADDADAVDGGDHIVTLHRARLCSWGPRLHRPHKHATGAAPDRVLARAQLDPESRAAIDREHELHVEGDRAVRPALHVGHVRGRRRRRDLAACVTLRFLRRWFGFWPCSYAQHHGLVCGQGLDECHRLIHAAVPLGVHEPDRPGVARRPANRDQDVALKQLPG